MMPPNYAFDSFLLLEDLWKLLLVIRETPPSRRKSGRETLAP